MARGSSDPKVMRTVDTLVIVGGSSGTILASPGVDLFVSCNAFVLFLVREVDLVVHRPRPGEGDTLRRLLVAASCVCSVGVAVVALAGDAENKSRPLRERDVRSNSL